MNHRPPTFFWLNTVIPILFLASVSSGTEEPKIYRYADWTGNGAERVMVQHYRLDDRVLSVQASADWSSIESEAGDFIRLHFRNTPDNQIEIRFTRLAVVPQDEAAALKLYVARLQEANPSLVVRRTRLDQRYVPREAAFPQTYSLARQENGPLTDFYTFFIDQSYLYMVSLASPARTEIGQALNDYSTLLRTFQIQPRVLDAKDSTMTSAGTDQPSASPVVN